MLLQEWEKKHKQVVTIYRSHLLAAVQVRRRDRKHTFTPEPARLDDPSYVLLAACSVPALGLSLRCETMESESGLGTRQMKFQKWCIEKWPDTPPGSNWRCSSRPPPLAVSTFPSDSPSLPLSHFVGWFNSIAEICQGCLFHFFYHLAILAPTGSNG